MSQISVEKALTRGRWLLRYIPVVLTIILTTVFTVSSTGIQKNYFSTYVSIALIIPLLLGYLATVSTYWRIWAFSRVTNVHQLKRRAIKEKLLTSDSNELPRIAFPSSAQKAAWTQIKRRFFDEDVFYDDKSVPERTLIFYSRKIAIFFFILGIVIVYFATLFTVTGRLKGYVMATTIALFGFYLIWRASKKISRRKPVLTLSSQGIIVLDSELLTWAAISDWQFVYRSKNYYLDINDGLHSIKLNTLRIRRRSLLYLLEIYQQRYENF